IGTPIGSDFLTLNTLAVRRSRKGNGGTATVVMTSTASAPFTARVTLSFRLTRKVGGRTVTRIGPIIDTGAVFYPGPNSLAVGQFRIPGGKTSRVIFMGYVATLA